MLNKKYILFFVMMLLPAMVFSQAPWGHGGVKSVYDLWQATLIKTDSIVEKTSGHGVSFGSNIKQDASTYHNWGNTKGAGGYGIWDDSGTLKYKNSDGSWANIGSGSGGINWYGVAWDAGYDADTYTRLGTLADSAASADIPDYMLPIQAGMERWVIDNAGNELYQLDPANSNKKITGENISLDGTNGQVMVKIAKFYYYFHYDAVDSIFTWKISQDSIAGYKAHPAFFKDSAWVDYRYIGAYEASMWDNSASAMCDSADIPSDIADSANDTLCSIACGDSIYVKTNEQRAEYRAMAANRGSGWRLMTYYDQSMIQLLYLVEYANFNSQTKIGNGRTALSGLSWVANSYIGKCGMSDGDGNFTGNVSPGDSSTSYMSYRGIENWYGNVWKIIDGIAWDGTWTGAAAAQPVYVSNDVDDFEDTQQGNMTKLCEAEYIGSSADYIDGIMNVTGFIPSSASGSSSTYLCDYYHQYSELGRDYFRLFLVGGASNDGSVAGGFAVSVHYVWSVDYAVFGARLCF